MLLPHPTHLSTPDQGKTSPHSSEKKLSKFGRAVASHDPDSEEAAEDGSNQLVPLD